MVFAWPLCLNLFMPELSHPKLHSITPAPIRPTLIVPVYAELAVTTNFSFLHGASHADELICRAAELGYRAIAVTDRNTLAGAVRMHQAAKQAGMKLLIGSRLSFDDSPEILAWATDRAAYGRLCRLLTLGRRRAEKGECRLFLSDLLEHSEGLHLALIPPDGDDETWTGSLRLLRETAGRRVSLAVSCLHGPRDRQRLEKFRRIAAERFVPLLAINDVHYHQPQRRELQDILTCIRHVCTIHDAGMRLFPNAERYLKPPEMMHRLFADDPSAIRRGLEIAEQCHFSLDELRYEYPDEVVPRDQTAIQYLEHLTWQGAAGRYPAGLPDAVRKQIEHELRLIAQLHYEPYFLTVYDLVVFARGRGILCQGRGSAANSAVCYCLGVTSVDPNRIDLLFERFISSARGEPPDIDVDFEHERREEVIQYVYEKYGRRRAGMTATVITYRGRSAVRDVGKALGLGLDLVDEMAKKLDWWDRGIIAEDRLRQIGLDPQDATIRRVVQITSQLLGFPRHLSQHVGGMVMTRGELCDLVPIENATMADRTVIQWDKDDIDALGILKVDVLALGMLTCINKALQLINSSPSKAHGTCSVGSCSVGMELRSPTEQVPWACKGEVPLELHTIPAEDSVVYDMICDADTIGVFQIESRAQMSMLPRLKPRNFYDLVIEVAIVRPGPIQGDMVHPYLRRRDGEEAVEYPSEALRQVLEKTLGVPLFQEQAMKMMIVGAGFSAEEADQLRRAMASWRRNGSIDRFQGKIIQGMFANGYTLEFAERCFNQIKGFGEYGFPESHAASFALLVYASSWIKRYHPAAFACALLNSQPMGFYAPAQIVRDARQHSVVVRPVDVNHSFWDCTLEYDEASPALRLGFRQIKGFSETFGRQIESARKQLGQFVSVAEFHRTTELPRSAVTRLAHADAFGSLGLPRRPALWQTLELTDATAPLFDPLPESPPDVADLPPMSIQREVLTDYATAGLSLKRHPVSLLRSRLSQQRVARAADLSEWPTDRWASVAGLVLIRQRPGTASGIVFVTLEDETGIANLIVRPHIYERYRSAACHAALLLAEGYVQRERKVVHLITLRLRDLSDWLAAPMPKSRDFH
jgi:error-prone DNA polymerase